MTASADHRALLLGNAWFRALPEHFATAVLSEGVVRRYRDQLIFAEGDAPNGLFALLEGEARIRHWSHDRGSAALSIIGPGDWFGETAMLDGQPRSSDAQAVGRVTVLQIAPPAFRRLTTDSVAHYAAFTRLVCAQYRRAMTFIVSTSSLPLRVRLARRLIALAKDHGVDTASGRRIDLKLSQESLADMVGVSRQSLNKALGDLRAAGLVDLGYATVAIRDSAGLTALAETPNEVRLPWRQDQAPKA